MTTLDSLHDVYDRLDAGEPIRILVGHALHRSTEIELVPGYATKLRAELLRGVGERIIALTAVSEPLPQDQTDRSSSASADAPSGSEPAGDSVRT